MTDPTELDQRVDQVIGDMLSPLKTLHEECVEERDSLRERAREMDKRVTKIEKTIRGMDPTFEGTRKKPGPTPKAQSNWTPSPAIQEKVVHYFDDHDQGTIGEIARSCDLAEETVRRCMDHLRKKQMVRLAGHTNRNARLWKPDAALIAAA